MAATCDYAYGNSATAIGSGFNHPKCMWIDGNYSKDGFKQGLSFHIPDFDASKPRAIQYTNIKRTLCDSEPRMHQHHKFNKGWKIRIFFPPLKPMQSDFQVDFDLKPLWNQKFWKYSDKPASKGGLFGRMIDHLGTIRSLDSRALTPRRTAPTWEECFGQWIVKSNITSHSARETCRAKNSLGPDFVSLQEQIYCDMKVLLFSFSRLSSSLANTSQSRQLHPTCLGPGDGSCFDLESNVLRGNNETMSADGTTMLFADTQAPAKSYEFVEEW